MRTIKMIFLFLILIFIFSCEKWGTIVFNCADCLTEEPAKANLEIKISNISNFSPVKIRVYEGNLEDSILYDIFQSTYHKISCEVLINKKYTLTARYIMPESTIIVINSVTPKVKYDETQCDGPCYYIYNKVVNLRLKYNNEF